ncbi:hypothetical protein Val02_05910 [Virgisporangium aliadipatigenens]|uniref:Uncharacterized protein n=1 Tax=Virgisporangium aliadipatigenens TaxID=741659 RepID=A0A8J4DME7_9ACTN|nr:hypothetical protein [Virgisporangium aliadipatigenens]GIJ43705.1 hypothetical protein Val02_05910 [Virgisporangium aliadipatigenens]
MDTERFITLAAACERSGDHRGAAAAYKQAGELAEQHGNTHLAAACAQAEAVAWWNAADAGRSGPALIRELSFRRQLDDPRRIAEVLVGLAFHPLINDRGEFLREAEAVVDANGYADLRSRLDSTINVFRSAGLDPYR